MAARVLVLGNYARCRGPHAMQLDSTGLPVDKTVFRMLHSVPQEFCRVNNILYSHKDVTDKVAFVDFSSAAIHGPRPERSPQVDAPVYILFGPRR
jgi:hypothetical protein